MKEMKRVWHLNRTILILVMAGYAGIMALLVIMDWYLITDYQRTEREREQKMLSNRTDEAGATIQELDSLLYNFYSRSDFDSLGRAKKSIEQYSLAYEIFSEIKSRAILSDVLDICYVFYNAYEKQLSYKYRDEIENETRREMGQALKEELGHNKVSRFTMTRELDGHLFYAIAYQRSKAAVAGVYDFERVSSLLQEDMGNDVQIVVLQAGNTNEIDSEGVLRDVGEWTGREDNHFRYWQMNHYIYGQRIKNTDIWVCMAVPCSLWTYLNVQQLVLLLISVSSLVAVAYLFSFIKKQVVYPIRGLTKTMNEIRGGDWKAVPDTDVRFKEIQEVNETLIAMVSEIEKQKMHSYEETIEKQKAQLQYLQLQLKPHFYLNGLKTLNAMVMDKQQDEMQDLIMNISVHLRYLLQSEKELVMLSAEIEFVENYIRLHQNMTGRPVTCEIFAEEEVRDWLVPTLCIQTFVENSLKYAKLTRGQTVLKLDITASQLRTDNGSYLDLVIRDNGDGYPEEILTEINGEPHIGSRSVGVNNMKRRCILLYGANVEYSFFNLNGACSEIILPERKV